MQYMPTFKHHILVLLLIALPVILSAKKQEMIVTRVDPPNWWTGMTEQSLELVFYGPNIQQYDVKLVAIGTEIIHITKPQNVNYLFIELKIESTQLSGDIRFIFTDKKKKKSDLSLSTFRAKI